MNAWQWLGWVFGMAAATCLVCMFATTAHSWAGWLFVLTVGLALLVLRWRELRGKGRP